MLLVDIVHGVGIVSEIVSGRAPLGSAEIVDTVTYSHDKLTRTNQVPSSPVPLTVCEDWS